MRLVASPVQLASRHFLLWELQSHGWPLRNREETGETALYSMRGRHADVGRDCDLGIFSHAESPLLLMTEDDGGTISCRNHDLMGIWDVTGRMEWNVRGMQ